LQALDAVQQDLDSLAEDCTHINGALAGAKAASADITAETERVSRELAASQLRSRLAEQFLQQYQLSPEEVTALQVHLDYACLMVPLTYPKKESQKAGEIDVKDVPA